ncbi:MAG: TAXI family TRAP transporter solute-binding subunit [Leptospiraceae bacterium]|nr:TAXI family TRAP transporter solute-binding subunit [Leptospiraceae bacterium]
MKYIQNTILLFTVFLNASILLLSCDKIPFLTKKENDTKKMMLLAAVLLSGNSSSQNKICTSAPGQGFTKFADGLIRAFGDENIGISKVYTNGSLDNSYKIADGTCNLALVQEDIFWKLKELASTESGEQKKALTSVTKMRTLGVMLYDDVHLVVNKNSGISKISDMQGKKVNLGPQGSGTLITAKIILESYGMNENSLIASYDSVSDSISKLANGTYDAIFAVSSAPIEALSKLSSSTNITLLKTDTNQKNGFYSKTGTISSSTYSWLTEDVKDNLQVISVLVADNTFLDNTTKTREVIRDTFDNMYKNKDEYATLYFPAWKNVAKENSWNFFKESPYGWHYYTVEYFFGDNPPENADLKICGNTSVGTYTNIAKDLIPWIESSLGLKLSVQYSVGSHENALNLFEGVCTMGILQEDVAMYLLSKTLDQAEGSSYNIILPLHNEDVHLLVNTSSGINTISDMQGKKVNLGPIGSGTYITAKLILDSQGFTSPPTYYTAALSDAAAGVQNGTYDAAFFVDVPPISELSGLTNVKLIRTSVNDARLPYTTNGTIAASNYSFQSSYGDVTNNLQVRALLVNRVKGFDDNKVATLLDTIFTNILDQNTVSKLNASKQWKTISKTTALEHLKYYPFGWGVVSSEYFINLIQ